MQGAGHRGIGGGFEDHRSGAHRLVDQRGFHRDPGRQRLGFKVEIAADVLAGEIHDRGVAVAARHVDDFPLLGVVTLHDRQRSGDRRLAAGDLKAVSEVRAATLELVADYREILAGFGSGPLQDRIGSAQVVVAGEVLALGIAHRQQGIERRAEAAGEHFQGEVFALGRLEGNEVVVEFRADDAVDGTGKVGCLTGLLGAGIRLDFGSRRERGNLDPQRGRGVDAFARREQEEAATGVGGNRD